MNPSKRRPKKIVRGAEAQNRKITYEIAQILYNTPPYKAWRESVLTRDGHRCQMCGQKGGKLEVHHAKPKRLYPELVLDKENGITLCYECHRNIVTGKEDKFYFIFKRIILLNIKRFEEHEVKTNGI